jgi:hypothetical protein
MSDWVPYDMHRQSTGWRRARPALMFVNSERAGRTQEIKPSWRAFATASVRFFTPSLL